LDRATVTLSTEALNSILAHEPADMTVTVQAGGRLTELGERLARHGQMLPLDPPGMERATVGGVLAADASGPLRHAYGTARDWLIGIKVVHADGTVSKSGGRVVKNVSGYDMHKLHVGSLGTLGVIVEATFKLVPLPQVDRTFVISAPSTAEARGVISAVHEAGLSVIAAELMSPAASNSVLGVGGWCALVRVGGGEAAVARTTDDLAEYAALAHGSMEDAPADVWSKWREAFGPASLSMRVSVMPSKVADVAEVLDRRFAGEAPVISATASVGLLRLQLSPADDERALALIEQVREIAARYGGFAIVDAASDVVKRRIDVFGAPGPDLEIMRRLKAELDPKGTLAPGRMWGRI
jgi:glycolate oxidase FAD binding subunit